MERQNKKKLIIDCAMRLIAKSGLENFSLAKVAKLAGTSERLIYVHFETKENLLYECFRSINQDIEELCNRFPTEVDAQSHEEQIRSMWFSYFDFLVESSYRTVFYFAYRNSDHILEVADRISAEEMDGLNRFVRNFASADDAAREKLLSFYIFDFTGTLAQRIIQGVLPDDETTRDYGWKLISRGLLGLDD